MRAPTIGPRIEHATEPQARLVELAMRGDQDAFAALVLETTDRLYAIATRILRDADLAGDAVQQTLLNVWRDLPGLRDPGRFDAWTYRLLVRACFVEARNRRRWIVNVLPLRQPGNARDAAGAIADHDEVERGFRRLSTEQRAVLVLHFWAGLPLTEVADILAIPVGTSRSRLHYAIGALRAAIEADARPGREVAR